MSNADDLPTPSAAVSAAYDILTDDGVPSETAARLAVAAERSGQNPETFARHFVTLRRYWRNLQEKR